MSAEEVAAASGAFAVRMSFAATNVAEQWRLFKRQLTYYFDSKYTAGQLTNRRKVGILMTALGKDGVEIFDTLFDAQEQPMYEDIVKKFDDYCSPKKNTVFERSVYFRLVQKPDQSVDMFVLSLKKQAALCEFNSAEKDKLLRDVLVIGIRDAKLREELLRDPDLDLPKAVLACKARERSQSEASQMALLETPPLLVEQVKRRFPVDRSAKACPSCSYLHGNARPCPALKATCKKCGQLGHFIKVCPNKSEKKPVQALTEQPASENEPQQIDLLKIYQCTLRDPANEDDDEEDAWYTDLRIGNSTCTFKLDTAAHCNTISVSSYEALVPKPPLLQSTSMLKPYNAPPFRSLGRVLVKYKSHILEFLVMPPGNENLLGFKSCRRLGLVKRVSSLEHYVSRTEFVKANADLFKGVGKIPGVNKIYVDETVQPTVAHWRRFAYSLVPKLNATLKEMVHQEIIMPVSEPTDWVSNITIVEKSDGTLRICLDPQNLNKVIKVPKFTIPKTDDILVHLNKKNLFTVIDLKSGFWHMELDDDSSKLTTFHSPLGRFRFRRLCFGINCAPEMFMAEMVRIFGDIKDVFPYFDDLIIATETDSEHDTALNRVCERARLFNVKFNIDKLQFKKPAVQFLGLMVSQSGVGPAQKHVRAMLEMPTPKDRLAVLRFLGLVKFLARFIPNVSQLTANLRHVTKKEIEFKWTAAMEKEFQELKKIIVSKPVLVFFDTLKAILIQTDSSKDGLGSVLLQDDQPVAFASRALTPTEVKYSQIEKELLAIVFAVECFHEYVYGLPVLVHSDHRPLESILRKELHKISPRLQRLRLRLLKYNVSVQYKPGNQMLVADALSRAFLQDESPNLEYQSVTVHCVNSLAVSPEKIQQIVDETKNDEVIGDVLQWVEGESWPSPETLKSSDRGQFYALRALLHVSTGLLFYENRLVVPLNLRSMFLGRLHEGHLGVEKVKRLARETVYWPGMTQDIASYVAECTVCQKFARNNARQPLQPYPIPRYPWQHLAIDIATFNGKDFLIVVDKFSNWPEVVSLSSKTALEIVGHLKSLFARHGIPEVVVRDNNPFHSTTYESFAEEWGFRAIFTSPHYSQANGHAERTVQTIKMLLRKCHDDGTSFHYALLQYRNTPIADTGFSPAQVLVGRRLRTKLPVASALLSPATVSQSQVIANKEKSQAVQKYYFDRSARDLTPLAPSQEVWVKDDQAEKQWQPATIRQVGPSPRSFVVEKEKGGTVIRNRQFLRPRNTLARPKRFCD